MDDGATDEPTLESTLEPTLEPTMEPEEAFDATACKFSCKLDSLKCKRSCMGRDSIPELVCWSRCRVAHKVKQ